MKTTKFAAHYFLCLLLLNLTACSSMQTVNVESAMQSTKVRGIDYGSLVEVKTLDKRTVKFRVVDITREGLGGNQGFYRYEDMKSLRVENPNAKNNDNTWSYILGALGIIALVALVANADSVAICSPSPCPVPPQ
jgi:hypothetical protein